MTPSVMQASVIKAGAKNPSAVVFAYHDVGVRCLKVLLSAGWHVPLVVTHADEASEARWFESVAEAATEHDVPVMMWGGTATAAVERRVAELAPDFIFSFYFRALLEDSVLRHARCAALNVHGSLLPRYRGRAPVNWAILRGESMTGATLHHMVARADAGDIVDQWAVPILEDDDAQCVYRKVTVAAEVILHRSLPLLAAGTAPRTPQNLVEGHYCGRRRPEDGRIDWRQSAIEIHNLVRAVAPPFPGAFADFAGQRWWIHRTQLARGFVGTPGTAKLFGHEGGCYLACHDGAVLRVLAAATSTGAVSMSTWARELELQPITLS